MQSDFPVQRLSDPAHHAVHAYYDLCPESPDGARVAWFEFEGEAPGLGRGVVAERDGAVRWRAPYAVEGNGHVGSFVAFADDHRVMSKRSGEQSGVTDLFDVRDSSAEPVTLVGDVRQVHTRTGLGLFKHFPAENNPHGLALAFRIIDLRPGADCGTVRAEVDTSKLHAIAKDCPAASETLHMQNLKWSPDGSRVLIVYTDEVWRRGRDLPYAKYKVLFTAGADGSDVRYLTSFAHHPTWDADGEGVIFYELDESGGQHLYHVDLDGEREMLCARFPGVHPTPHPDRPWIITDVWDAEAGHAEILAFDVKTWARIRLARFEQDRFAHVDGFHPHPVLSRDGKRVYFNAMDGGRCGVHALELG